MTTLFLGDSHTCGYQTVADKTGIGSYSAWNDNNYAERYAHLYDTDVAVYAMPGATNDSYTNWLRVLLNYHENVDKVYILLSGFNRFCIAGNTKGVDETPIPVNHFTRKVSESNRVIRYADDTISGDNILLYQKPISDDYSNFVPLQWSTEDGLVSPDLRKNTYMEVKTFYELNTHLEQQNFLKNVFLWDTMCKNNNAELYLFKMTDRLVFPKNIHYYGTCLNTWMAKDSVETFFRNKNLDHTRFYLEDQEHYNIDYHTMIADKFIPAMESEKKTVWNNLYNDLTKT